MTKILVTIGAILIFLLIFGVLIASQKSSGNSNPGIFGIILFGGLIAAIRAIWKKPDSLIEKKKEDDNFKLDKTI